jgi:hypothetical protein
MTEEKSQQNLESQRKPYEAPAITHELVLETRAGSPFEGGRPIILPGEGDELVP